MKYGDLLPGDVFYLDVTFNYKIKLELVLGIVHVGSGLVRLTFWSPHAPHGDIGCFFVGNVESDCLLGKCDLVIRNGRVIS